MERTRAATARSRLLGAAFLAILCLFLLAWAASGHADAAIDLPLSKVTIGRSCDQRLIEWTQDDSLVTSWTLELRQIFSANGAPAYDERPLRYTIEPIQGPHWRGVVGKAGVFQVRVRADYLSASSTWTESTSAQGAKDAQPFLLVLFLCPPGGFEPK